MGFFSLQSEGDQFKSKGKNARLFCNVGNLVHVNNCWIKSIKTLPTACNF